MVHPRNPLFFPGKGITRRLLSLHAFVASLAGWLATILQVLAQSVFIVVACDRPLCPPAWVSKPWRGFGITLFYGITKQQNFPDLFSPFESGIFFFSLCCFSQKPITMMMGMDCIFHKTQPCTDACKGDGCYRKSHLGLPLDKQREAVSE